MKKISQNNNFNSFWLKIIGTLLTACILFIVATTYSMDRLLVRIENDMSHISSDMKNFRSRLDDIENSMFTIKDANQLQRVIELKLKALETKIKNNKER